MNLTLEGRRKLHAKHPAFQRYGYELETESLKFCKELVLDWVELRKSGIVIQGLTCAGKSTAIGVLQREIERKFKNALVAAYSSETQTPLDSHERVYTEFLQQAGLPARSRSVTCNVFANYLLTKCWERRADMCVLFVDEAQKLYLKQWEALGVVWNRLRMNGLTCCVYSFGNEKLGVKRLLKDGDGDGAGFLAGRFFVQEATFFGIRTEAELLNVLRQFDETLIYPMSGWPYSRFFAQSAYDLAKWRLQYEAKEFWAALDTHCPVSKVGYSIQWVTDPIHAIFKECLLKDDLVPGEQELPWLEAIKKTCPSRTC